MISLIRSFISICFVFSATLLSAVNHTPDKDISAYTELEYDDENGVPVIEVKINGNTYRFLFDTGATMTTISDRIVNAEKLDYRESPYKVQGYDQKIFIASIPAMNLGNIVRYQEEVMIMSEHNPIFKALKTDGTIGASSIMDYIVSFDSRKKKIILSEETDIVNQAWDTLKLWNNVPLFSIKLKGENELYDVPALFDTGNGTKAIGIPSVEGFKEWEKEGIIRESEEGAGALGMMIGGLQNSSLIYRGRIRELYLGDGKYENIPIISGGIGYLLLCFEMTRLGSITIDYPNKRYYFKPYTGATLWDYPLLPVFTGVENGKLRIAAVWGKRIQEMIKPGDYIKAIGKHTLSGLEENAPNVDMLIRQYGAENEMVEVGNSSGSIIMLPASLFLP